MNRALHIVFLLTVAVAAVPLAASADACEAETADCEESCPGDDAEGDCPPGCDDCSCCGGIAQAAPVSLSVRVVEPARFPVYRTLLSEGRAPDGVSHRVFRPPRSVLS